MEIHHREVGQEHCQIVSVGLSPFWYRRLHAIFVARISQTMHIFALAKVHPLHWLLKHIIFAACVKKASPFVMRSSVLWPHCNFVCFGAPQDKVCVRVYHCALNRRDMHTEIKDLDNVPDVRLLRFFHHITSHSQVTQPNRIPITRISVETASNSRHSGTLEYDQDDRDQTLCTSSVATRSIESWSCLMLLGPDPAPEAQSRAATLVLGKQSNAK